MNKSITTLILSFLIIFIATFSISALEASSILNLSASIDKETVIPAYLMDCREQDSLVLAELYNATDGVNWTNTWDLNQSMDTWYGVTLNADGCVIRIDMDGVDDINCPTCSGGGNSLRGEIPNNFWSLSELRFLNLNNNFLGTPSFPIALTSMVKLEYLNLGDVNLNGALPSAIGNLVNLTTLSLGDCNLTGLIPDELGNLTNLAFLNLPVNQLSGTIPYSLNNLTKLTWLNLKNNEFTGLADLRALNALNGFFVSNNPIGGNIPEWISNLVSLSALELSNTQMDGAIPDFFGNFPNLFTLTLSDNNLIGGLPTSLVSNNIGTLYLQNNQLSGVLPTALASNTSLRQLLIHGNNFEGLIPNFSIPATNLRNLNIHNNQFTFEDIIPHFMDNKNIIAANGGGESYTYQPQAKIGIPTNINVAEGTDYTFNLGIDDTVTTNIYTWYKNGNLYQTINGNNSLSINNASSSDVGVYTCDVTNPNAPDLILESFNYALLGSTPINDDVCNAQLLTVGVSVTGSFENATNQENEPVVTGNDCQANWCNTDLHGSVWYSFILPENPTISISATGSDTKIALYEGIDCTLSNPFENATLIDANDDNPSQCCGSLISLACLEAGSLYFIQVDQYSANQGDFEITVNQMISCELPCDLTLTFSDVEPMTCPGSNDAVIRAFANSAVGHQLVYDLYDNNNQLIRTELTGDIFGLSTGTYSLIARSLDDANCSLDLGGFVIINDVDNNAPEVNCLNETQNVAYVRGSNGSPWNDASYTNEMDSVFTTNWQEFTYGSINPQLLFSDGFNFIYLEGNNHSNAEFKIFMNTNRQLIEDWVALGNSLLVNMGDDFSSEVYEIGFGGVTFQGNIVTESVTTINPNHPIFVGPSLPTVTTLGGYSFANGIIDASAINATPLLEAPNGADILVEANWGSGTVFFGSMHGTNFHFPSPEAFNVKANMLAYLADKAIPAANTPIQLPLDETQTATLTPAMINVGSFDNCELAILEVNQSTFNCNNLDFEVDLVILSATDASGNVGTCASPVLVTNPNNYCSDGADICLNERIINEVSIENGVYNSATTITSSGTILADTSVLFVAGESITLQAGFHAKIGSHFDAFIGACTPAPLQDLATERTQPLEIKKLNDTEALQLKAYPNPFNETATIEYYLPTTGHTTIRLMDFMGKEINLLSPNQQQAAGWHQLSLSAIDLPTGAYFLVLQNERQVKTTQLIVVH